MANSPLRPKNKSLRQIIRDTDLAEKGMPTNLRMTDEEFIIPEFLCHDPEVDARVDDAIREGREAQSQGTTNRARR